MRNKILPMTAILACLCGGAGLAQTTLPASAPAAVAPATQPAIAPAATSAPAPVTQPAPTSAPVLTAADLLQRIPDAQKEEIRFQFDGIGYGDVVRRFAQAFNKPLVGDVAVEGTLTFFDCEPYCYKDALDTLNTILATKGCVVIEIGRFLKCVPLTEVQQIPLPLYRGMEQAEKARPGEIVSVMLPLKYISAEVVAKSLSKMVSNFGAIMPLGKGKGVVITDRLSNIKRIRDLIGELDTAETTADRLLKTFVLKKASATSAATTINTLFGTTGVGAKGGKKFVFNAEKNTYEPTLDTGENAVTAAADERTNSILVMGPSDKLALIEQVLTKLDEVEGPTAGDFRIYELKNARADELATTLRQSLGLTSFGGAGPETPGVPSRRTGATRITADTATNNLIVSATPDQLPAIEKLIKDLDKATPVTGGGVKIVRLKSADAQQLAQILLASRPQTPPAELWRSRGKPAFSVQADPRSNSLILAGTAGDIQAAAALIDELDREQDKQAREIHVVQLKSGEARQVAEAIVSLFAQQGPRHGAGPASNLRVEPEPTSNSLFIACSPGDWKTIESILSQIKTTTEPLTTPTTRLLPLKYAKASEIAETLRQMYGLRRYALRQGQAPVVPVTIAPSDRSNSLLVSAADDDHKTIAELVKSMDVPTSEKIDEVQIIRLQAADADKLANTLRAMMPSREGTEVFIQSDSLTNSVLVRAPESQRKMLQEMIAKLDTATQQQAREMRMVNLKSASATALSGMLNQLYVSRAAATQSPSRRWRAGGDSTTEQIIIAPAPGDKTLIVDAPRAKMEEIVQLVASLDTKDSPGTCQFRTYQLDKSNAEEVARTLERLFAQQAERRQQAGANEIRPTFECDRPTNQLLISASAAQFEIIEQIIKQIQSVATLSSQTKTFQLKFAKADEIVEMLQPMLTGSAATTYSYRRAMMGGESRVAAMRGANAVIVQGPPDKIALAEQLIASVDKAEVGGKAVIQVVPLKNAQAYTLGMSLAQSLSSRGQGRGDDVSVTPEINSNSLIVRGPSAAVSEAVEMIKSLDDKSVTTGTAQVRVFKLANAKPEVLAKSVTALFESMNSHSGGRWSGRPTTPFSVTADERTNSLVVSTVPSYFALVEELLKSLDKPEAEQRAGLQVVPLKNAQANMLAQSVSAALGVRWSQRDDSVTVTAEPNSNAVIVRGPAKELPEVIEMIKGLDAESTSVAAQVRVYPLTNGVATDLARSLATLFQGMIQQQSLGRSGVKPPPFNVTADDRTNSLVVSTTPAHFALVEELLRNLDKQSQKLDRDAQYVWLENADATDVASKLTTLYKDKRTDKPVIEADPYSNALTVIAKDEDLKAIQSIVEKLDKAAKDNNLKVRVIPLTQVKADKMAQVLQQVYGQMTDSHVVVKEAPTTAPATQPSPSVHPQASQPRDDASAELAHSRPATQSVTAVARPTSQPASAPATASAPAEELFGSGKPTVTIAVDKTSNSLVVSGSRRELERIDQLVKDLTATAATSEAEFRAFELKKADPTAVARTLEELFNPKGQQRQPGVASPWAPAPAPLPSGPSVAIAADIRTKSIIVRGRQTDFDIIEPIIKHLDNVTTVVSEVKVFTLKNTDAADVATNLRELFTPQQASQERGGGMYPVMTPFGSPYGGRRGGGGIAWQVQQMYQDMETGKQVDPATLVNISANRPTNTVVVSAPADAMKMITRLIEELDQSAALSKVCSIRMYPLKNAQVRTTVQSLQQLFGTPSIMARGATGGRRGGGMATSAPSATTTERIIITGDEVGRLVIVSAPEDKHELVAKVIHDIDNAQAGDQVTIKVYTVKNVDASGVAAAMLSTLSADVQRSGGKSVTPLGQLRISADDVSNCLVVRASQEDHDKIASLLEQMDVAATERCVVQLIPLAKADPAKVAMVLRNVFAPPQGASVGGRGGRGGAGALANAARSKAVIVEADVESRNLMVRADEATFARILELAKKLDEGSTAGQSGQVIVSLKHAHAVTVAAALTQAFTAPRGTRPAAADDIVSVVAEPFSNSVIITANKDKTARIQSLLEKLDTESTSGTRTAFLVLQNARAVDLALILGKIAGSPTATAGRKGGTGAVGAGQPMPTVVSGDAGSNALVVSGPSADVDNLLKIAADLDKASVSAGQTVVMVPLKNAQASSVAPALTAAFSAQKGQKISPDEMVTVVAEQFSNSVIITANKDKMAKVQSLLEKLDSEATSGLRTAFLVLKNAKAADLAMVLGKIAGVTPAAGRKGAPAGGQSTATIVSGDVASNALVISGPAADVEKLLKIAGELDQASVSAGTTAVVIALKNAQAATVAPAMTAAFAAQKGQKISPEEVVTVVAEPFSNSLIVTASAANMDKVRKLVAAVDTDVAGGLKREFVILKNADAVTLAGVLAKAAQSANAGKGSNIPPVVITGDAGSNAIVMSGPAKDLEVFRKMAEDLDNSSSKAAETHIIALKNSEAESVAATIRSLFQQQLQNAQREKKTLPSIAVTADNRANALIVSASKEAFDEVSRWVMQIEQMKPARGTLRLITLQQADPAEVDKAIQQMFNNTSGASVPGAAPAPRRTGGSTGAAVGGGASTGSKTVETSVLTKQRSILITANEEDYEAIKKVVSALDAAAASARQKARVFALKNANNTTVAAALNQLYRTVGKGATAEDVVIVSALAQTNAVVVTAIDEKMAEIAHLIEELDRQEVAPTIEFRIYPLAYATPSKLLPSMKMLLAELQKAKPDQPINVQADDRTKSVIVSARGGAFEQVEKIVKSLDQPPATVATEVLIVPLKHADAARLAAVLTDMLKPSPDGQITAEAKALQEQVRLLRVRSSLAEMTPELDLTKPIKITADPAQPQGSNALVIASVPDNLKALRAIVEMLDVAPLALDSKVRICHLKNANAKSVADILKDIFTQGQKLAGKTGTTVAGKAEPPTASGKALVNTLNVSADLRTNSVVLSGCEESLALAESIIQKLDDVSGVIVTEVRLFRLKHADAVRMAPQLQAVFMETAATAAAASGAEGLQTQVTRLRTVLDKQLGHVTEQPKTRAALTIQADQSTNILIVAARSDVMPLIADVVGTMDIPGAGSLNMVRIFPLVNADATRLQTVVSTLYTGPNAKLVRDEDKPTIAVDTRTNALIVSASDKTFAMLETVLRTLDSKTPIELKDIRLVPLQNADATGLATTLQKMMDARVQRLTSLGAKDADALRVIVLPDTRSNSLLVGASAEGYELVKSLATQLDGASPALSGQVQLIPLVHANAGALSVTLTNLFNQRYQAARTPDVARQKPVILSDLRTNSLLVAANQDDSKVLAALMEKLDVKLSDPAVQLVVLPIKYNDAGVVGPIIKDLFAARLKSMTPPGQTPVPQDNVDLDADSITNSLIVSASKENLTLIRGLLERLDVEPPTDTGVLKIYVLNFADATSTAALLKNLVTQGLYKPGLIAASTNKLLAAREKVSITSDARLNAVIISASKENLVVMEQIIKRMDVETPPLLGDIRIYMLKRADCTKLGPMLQQFFSAKRQAELTVNNVVRSVPVVVVPDARTNTLLVAGGRENFAACEDMIKQLDSDQCPNTCDFKVFYLKQATAVGLQAQLQQLFANRPTRTGIPKDPITVLAEAKSNSLMVGASIDDMKMVESLIEKLDANYKDGTTVHVFPLAHGQAPLVATSIKTLFQSQGIATAGMGISVDERMNAIIFAGGAADAQRVQDLVKQLDGDAMAQVTEIRVFTLQNADATDLAKILTDALTSKPKSPITTLNSNRQALLQFITHTPEGRDLVASALQEGVLITPDRRTNSIVVSAPQTNMPLLESLIKALDTTSPRMAQIKVFTLVNADVRQMADVLTQLFRLQSKGATGAATGTVNNTNTIPAVNYTLVSSDGKSASATLGSAEDYTLAVTVDMRTNSLLLGGTKQYVDLAAKIIESLDASPAQERVTEVYRLRNARATDVQTALRAFLDQERTRLVSTLGKDAVGAAQRLLEHEVAVVAVNSEGVAANANTLLLSASPRYFKQIADMVKELDQPPPQVLIQVLLAEVTLDDATDLGFEWNYKAKFDNGTQIFNTGTNLGVAAGFAKTGGFNMSITGGDLTFFLRALQSQGKLEVLSRPQILASDNQMAKINVGQRVPFITDSRLTDNGTQINTIQYQDVGIILQVTPRINPDGFVKLDVAPEISSLSTSTVPISAGVNAPIINTRKAQSTVTVQDGHTIVIGGLITNSNENRETKVPFLGDIPIIGYLFKKTTVSKNRTELLIIMTPSVLRATTDADRVTNDQIRRVEGLREMTPDQLKSYMSTKGKFESTKTLQEREFDSARQPAPTATQPAGDPAGGASYGGEGVKVRVPDAILKE